MSQAEIHTDILLEACKNGDHKAQMEVYKRYYKAMYNTSLRIVKDRFEAEDIMQESFLSAFEKLHTFRGEVSFGAWLKRIVINNSIYQYRKAQKAQQVPLEQVGYKVEGPEGYVQDDGQAGLKAQKVLQSMQQLKDNYRLSLTLHLIEGYDYEEICEIMNISYANCRTIISRAKESLRKKILTPEL